MTSTVITGIAELVTNDEHLEGADHSEHLGRLSDAAVIVQDGLIAWVGPASRAPEADDRRHVRRWRHRQLGQGHPCRQR
jgi:imidazolonepropionase